MKRFEIASAFAGLIVAPGIGLLLVHFGKSDHDVQLWTYRSVLLFGFVFLVLAYMGRSRDVSSFRKPRTWARLGRVPGVHSVARWLKSDHGARAKRHKTRVMNHLAHVLQDAGTATIFSRDLSWIDDKRVFDSMLRLAKDSGLTLFAHKNVERTRHKELHELLAAGASIHTYTQPAQPPVRFTLVHKSGRAVIYVAKETDDFLYIEQISDSEHLAFRMANCIVDLTGRAPFESVHV